MMFNFRTDFGFIIDKFMFYNLIYNIFDKPDTGFIFDKKNSFLYLF
jgi:hypothetical protein